MKCSIRFAVFAVSVTTIIGATGCMKIKGVRLQPNPFNDTAELTVLTYSSARPASHEVHATVTFNPIDGDPSEVVDHTWTVEGPDLRQGNTVLSVNFDTPSLACPSEFSADVSSIAVYEWSTGTKTDEDGLTRSFLFGDTPSLIAFDVGDVGTPLGAGRHVSRSASPQTVLVKLTCVRDVDTVIDQFRIDSSNGGSATIEPSSVTIPAGELRARLTLSNFHAASTLVVGDHYTSYSYIYDSTIKIRARREGEDGEWKITYSPPIHIGN